MFRSSEYLVKKTLSWFDKVKVKGDKMCTLCLASLTLAKKCVEVNACI